MFAAAPDGLADGAPGEEVDEVVLSPLRRGLEGESRGRGAAAIGRRRIPPTDDHVGSTVALLEAI